MIDRLRRMHGRRATRHSPLIPFLVTKVLMTNLILAPATGGYLLNGIYSGQQRMGPFPPGSVLEASLEAGQTKAGPITLAFNIDPGGKGAILYYPE